MAQQDHVYLFGADVSPLPGMVIVHNHVQPRRTTPSGTRGFRAWRQPLQSKLEPCPCGWRGVEHYRVSRDFRRKRGRPA